MLRYLLIFCILANSLLLSGDLDVLKRANGFIKSKNKSNQFRAYNDYKNVYLRSIMSNNEKLRIKALNGIVKSGKKLHIDVSQYETELSHVVKSSMYTKVKKKQKKKTTASKIKIKSSHKLKSVRWIDERLVLKFDKELNRKQVNYFTLYDSKNKKYRYIFDIHASMLSKSQTLRKAGINRIKLAQYNSNTLRLVIEDNAKVKVRFKQGDKSLKISIDATQNKKIVTDIKTPRRVDRSKTIVLDAGHGGKDPGAIGYRKYREKIVVMQVAKYLKSILKSRGYKVYMTREKDKFIKLSSRTKFANKKNADLFISIHANAVEKKNAKKAHGIECYFLSKSRSGRAKRVASKENSADLSEASFFGKESFLNTLNHHNIIASNKLAIDLQRSMLSATRKKYKDVKDAGVREAPFWVLVGATMPSVLIEIGFITHPKEARRLVNSKYQKTLATGMADGIERYFINCH